LLTGLSILHRHIVSILAVVFYRRTAFRATWHVLGIRAYKQ
jgi:hypothetical protein